MSIPDHMQFDNICRTCLSQEPNMKSIFDTDCNLGETLQLYQMLIAFTSVQVQEDDGLPAQICLSCIENIAGSFSFKKLCEESDSTLRKVLGKSTIKNSEALIGLKPSEDVALCSQETVADIDPSVLDIKMEFEEEDTKIDQHLISHTEYVNCEEVDIKMMENADNVTPPVIEPSENTKSDDTKGDLTVGSALKIHTDTQRKLRHQCDVCAKVFSCTSVVNRHMKKVHGRAKSYTCTECDRIFHRSCDFTRHLRSHTLEKVFVCKFCDQRFAQSCALLEHVATHTHDKDLICADCGRGFYDRITLNAHRKTHPYTKMTYLCSICGKLLSSTSNLASHMKMHKGVKDHVCPDCGKAFSEACNLVIHQRRHTGEKRFICEVCGSGYVTNSQLKQHMPVHTGEKPFKCSLCPKAFSYRGSLQEHIRRHNGERKFTCKYCQKGFYQSFKLKVHMRLHTGEKPHTCKICGKSFRRLDHLSVHLKIH